MNLLLFEPAELRPAMGDDTTELGEGPFGVTLRGRRARHLVKVLGVSAGSDVRAGVLNGAVGAASVLSTARDAGDFVVELQWRPSEAPPAALGATLILALPRPKFLGRILQWAATFGVKSIVLADSERVEKSYWGSSLMEGDALRRHLVLGLEQGRDTKVPELVLVRSFPELLREHVVPRTGSGRVWVAHGDADNVLPASFPLPVTLCVGPEGGWLDHEIEALEDAGAQLGSLGDRPLRVETAVAVLLGRCLPGGC